MNIFKFFFNQDDVYIPLYKDKQYLHFDIAVGTNYIEDVISKVRSDNKLEHGFYPLILYKMPKFKYIKSDDGRFFIDKKTRPVMHTARTDAMIYAFYRAELINHYENFLHNHNISEHVIAYRRIPNQNSNSNKCNVHFANEAINEIIERKNCCAIAMDITKFFDTLNHEIVKKQWLKILNKEILPDDHYKIYKNITRYRYITAENLEKALDIKLEDIYRENQKKQKEKRKTEIRLIKNGTELRDKIIPNLSPKSTKGIPQGTTISDAIANIYMLDFDKKLAESAQENNWYYRRYSDDILIICDINERQKALDLIKNLIDTECKLEINDKKTLISEFTVNGNKQNCKTYDNNAKYIKGKPFEYLGLSFDGENKRIRNSTLAKFYQKLKSRIHKEVKKAKNKLEKPRGPTQDPQKHKPKAKKRFTKKKKQDKTTKTRIRNYTSEQLYKAVSLRTIYKYYLGKYSNEEYREAIKNCQDKEAQKAIDDEWRNFYSYVELVAKVTGDPKILNIFNDTVKWIRKTVKEKCQKICA